MDILQELPVEHWPSLQEKLKKLWPINVPGYYTLWLYLKHPQVREAFQFKVYCPYGNMEHGFIGTSSKSAERIKNAIGFSFCDGGIANMYFLGRDTQPFDLRLPADTYAAPVKEEHLNRVNETWPHKYEGSQYFFTVLSRNGLSYGLYSLTHELLAWVFINDFNFLCHLYCEEGHRKKGYAEYIMKWAVNDQLVHGNDIYGYVIVGNEKPVKIFKKLGFEVADDGGYIYAQK